MAVKKNDFIEIEFTGKIKDTDEIFDTNIKADAKNTDLNLDVEKLKPFIMSIGNKMLPEGFDNNLEGKQIGKKYTIEISPEKAFGKRNSQLIRMVPLKIFNEQKINPQRGMQLNLGGQLARVLSASGGRILVDFNNPLAGKAVTYNFKILKKIDNQDQRINALQDFLFRKKFPFTEKEKTITFQLKEDEKQLEKLIEMMAPQFKEILGMKIKTEVKKSKQPAAKK
ncbi:hypothetical protein CMI37_26600 [Candidatus Pacearchaeota archaeon]|nr:hypothetical protein [Candidatus Pacearchaeota archaeon]|tara:strand:+ start:1602 stop:2276 length:675 start_codon:yes stop_codon:yes gene_type:complete